jgi:hypothetical protein
MSTTSSSLPVQSRCLLLSLQITHREFPFSWITTRESSAHPWL